MKAEPCERYVSPKTIQQKMDVTAKTVRNWSKKFNWRFQKINSRVIRYCAEDVEETLNIKIT
jgi:predicted site-specific integrase-resolvase